VPRRAGSRPAPATNAASTGCFIIDGDLKEFVESGVAVLVGTSDADRHPHVTYGWGPRVRHDGSTIDVFLDQPRAEQTLANARDTGRIAMTIADPVSVRSVQFKGLFIEAGDASDQDLAWVQRHREAFVVSTSLVGDPPAVIRSLWIDEVVRLSFRVERGFDQTPGPNAGQPL
jgi:hypothetical protein